MRLSLISAASRPKFVPSVIAHEIETKIKPFVDRVGDWKPSSEAVYGGDRLSRTKEWTDARVEGPAEDVIGTLDRIAHAIDSIVRPLGLTEQPPFHPGWNFKQRHYKWSLKRGKEEWSIWMPCYQDEYGDGRHRAHIQVTAVTRSKA